MKVLLPQDLPRGSRQAGRMSSVITQPVRCERIMIVDDDLSNRTAMAATLRNHCFDNLVMTADSRDALRLYCSEKPDLVLLERDMPHLDGYQVMQQLRALNDPLMPPVILLARQHDEESLQHAQISGIMDFLTTPVVRTELLMRVRNLLDVQLNLNQIHNQMAHLKKCVEARNAELHNTRLQSVKRLAMAAEFRDSETGNHILRMSHSCAFLARAIGWSASDAELLLHASPMHDIGKLGIPDAILLKPGRLDAQEWEIMKTHATIGSKLLEHDSSDLMRMARDIAHTHHEKWDGSGYPNGLSGDQIPEAGRIVALADVFDALISERPYKPAWSVKAAVEFIQANSGKQFDPTLVRVFLARLPEILALRQQFADTQAGMPGHRA